MPARDLYCSDWFVKAKRYVEQEGYRWFILSAKYGLVQPERVIAPYDVTLLDLSAPKRQEWASDVLGALRPECERNDRVVVLAGQVYRAYLVGPIRQWAVRSRC